VAHSPKFGFARGASRGAGIWFRPYSICPSFPLRRGLRLSPHFGIGSCIGWFSSLAAEGKFTRSAGKDLTKPSGWISGLGDAWLGRRPGFGFIRATGSVGAWIWKAAAANRAAALRVEKLSWQGLPPRKGPTRRARSLNWSWLGRWMRMTRQRSLYAALIRYRHYELKAGPFAILEESAATKRESIGVSVPNAPRSGCRPSAAPISRIFMKWPICPTWARRESSARAVMFDYANYFRAT